jgi:membrane associated rhomboid family serine protease
MRCPDCARQRTKVHTLRNTVRRPRVTFALIAANVLVFLTEQGQFTLGFTGGTGVHGKVVEEGILARVLTVVSPDGQVSVRLPIADEHQYWRLVTNGFLHASILHLAFNMYLLYLLGMMLEPAIGSARFAAIYFTSLLAGSFAVLFSTAAPTLGASGAIFGLMGAAVVELRARGIGIMASGIGGLIILNLILSVSLPDISLAGHVGGLTGGALAGLAIRTADDRRQPALGFAGCLAISAIAVAGSLAVAGTTGPGFA